MASRHTLPPSDFVALHTPRCTLRRIVPDDLSKVFEALSDPRVTRHYGVHYDSLDATREQMDWFDDLLRTGTGRWWAICRHDAVQPLLGACGLNAWQPEHRRAELGYWLLPAHQGQGLMRECLSAVLRHGFAAMQLHRIEADVESENDASTRLLDALGFRCEGRRRQCEFKHGHFIDLHHYALLAPEVPDALR